MSQVLEKLRKVDPNDGDAVKESVNGFFQNVTRHTEVGCEVWLLEMEKIITRFPRAVGPHGVVAARFLAHFLSARAAPRALAAARAAHALLQVRPAGGARAAWRDRLDALCGAAHGLLDALYPGAAPAGPSRPDKCAAPAECPLRAALRDVCVPGTGGSAALVVKLRNVLLFIQAMLVEVYPVSKPVQARLVLDVVARALRVAGAARSEPELAALVQRHALHTLDALIACLGSNLIPWSSLVVRCATHVLRWSRVHCGLHVAESRCLAYACLCRWASVAGLRAGQEELAAHLAADLAHTDHTVQLTMNHQYAKKLSKKARRKLTTSLLQQSVLATHAPSDTNGVPKSQQSEELVVAALRCAELLLPECAPAHCAMLVELLVRRAHSLSGLSSACALGVLRALHASRAAGHHAHLLLQLYGAHLHHHHHQIRTFCWQGLLELKLQLHGSPASLNFAPEPSPRKHNSLTEPNKMSRKNRAALQSLLGKDRCDSSLMAPSSDDVITIGDEPPSKRPLLESQVITDNISVSSDSVEALDATDDDVIVDADREIQRLPWYDADVQSHMVTKNVEGADSICEQVEECDIIEGADIRNLTEECEQPQLARVQQTNIYEAKTQVPLNTSTDQDTIDDNESPVSMEIVYDPNVTPSSDQYFHFVNKVTVLDRTEDDTLPSTNDTDDVQITCGQIINNSQDLNVDINKTNEEILKVNGVGDKEVVDVEDNDEMVDNLEVKSKSKEITVDDMLADFVDEPNDVGKFEA